MKPAFATCPVCKKVLRADEVIVDALVDGEEVKICTACNRRSRIILEDIPRQWVSNLAREGVCVEDA